MVSCGLGVTLAPNVAASRQQTGIIYREPTQHLELVELSLLWRADDQSRSSTTSSTAPPPPNAARPSEEPAASESSDVSLNGGLAGETKVADSAPQARDALRKTRRGPVHRTLAVVRPEENSKIIRKVRSCSVCRSLGQREVADDGFGGDENLQLRIPCCRCGAGSPGPADHLRGRAISLRRSSAASGTADYVPASFRERTSVRPATARAAS